eukprot:TRINITY_DN11469_c0_g1_i1.p1 TRINITY_DN11469_c0_g1~~TRINITY_DN11469_c0_g1_i1.p1  ORF type:complete len:326 (+),score=62.01 TRINITY_DN11469_c0_g1_i1:116-1093(+)
MRCVVLVLLHVVSLAEQVPVIEMSGCLTESRSADSRREARAASTMQGRQKAACRSLDALSFLQLNASASVRNGQGAKAMHQWQRQEPPLRHAGLLSLLALPEQVLDQIEQNLPYSTFWGELRTFPARCPRLFNVGLATFKTWLADLVVQSTSAPASSKQSFGWLDRRRSAAFAAFGFLYVGLIEWLLYVSALSTLCPRAIVFANEPWSEKLHDKVGQVDLLKQVGYDNFLMNPFIYFPVFYVIKGCCMRAATASKASKSSAGVLPGKPEALQQYRQNFFEDNLVSCCVWVPADLFVFAAPIYLRMPLDHLTSFVWTMLLSYRAVV